MALIRCPECGKEVSDQAAACIHCGYPLRTADLPARYALILVDPGPNPGKTAAVLHDRLTLTQAEAQALTEESPAVAGYTGWMRSSLASGRNSGESISRRSRVPVTLPRNR